MKKPRPPRPKRRKKPENVRPSPPPLSPKSWWTPLRKLGAILGGCATVMGAITAAISLLPRITADISVFDESNAYSISFKVTNTSVIPLEDLSLSVGFCEIETAKRDFYVTKNNCERPSGLPYMRIGSPDWGGHRLTHDEQFTITLADEMTVRTQRYTAEHPQVIAGMKTLSALVSADAVLVVTYRPWFIPITQVKPFRFIAATQPNDKVMWKAVPFDR